MATYYFFEYFSFKDFSSDSPSSVKLLGLLLDLLLDLLLVMPLMPVSIE